jgi:hypothetical protein
MSDYSLAISALALALSALTAWLTLFRRGTIKMTQPTLIFFGPDINTLPAAARTHIPKIYFRTLLFSTSKRGRVIENMHVALSRNETHQNFNLWSYGETQLHRGSGLFIGETGMALNHHFLAPMDAGTFQFLSGKYRLEVFAHLLGTRKPLRLFVQELEVTPDLARVLLTEIGSGLFFNWGPDSSRYFAHTERGPKIPDILSALGLGNLGKS